jgi:uncharacterized protein
LRGDMAGRDLTQVRYKAGMRFVWLHGFASGPSSSKGQFVRARLAERGVELLIPDLNDRSFFSLTVTRMLARTDELAGNAGPALLFGSSLGGYAAATWAATRPGRTAALVLLAPAFDLARRWRERMPPADLARWRETGRFAFDHYAHGGKEDLSIGFLDDAEKYEPFPLPDAPTLVVQGRRDEVVDPQLAREFVRRMDGRARLAPQGAPNGGASGASITLVELDEGHELTADLPGLWRRMEPFLQPWLPRPTP